MGNGLSGLHRSDVTIRVDVARNQEGDRAAGADRPSSSRASGATNYKPWRPGAGSNHDVCVGDWGWWSSRCKPIGFVDYRDHLASMPMVYRPVDGYNLAVRQGSPIDRILKRVFEELDSSKLGHAGLSAVFFAGQHPDRFESLLTLVDFGLINVRHDHPAALHFHDALEPTRTTLNLVHRIACQGHEPPPGKGLSLKERFMGLRRARVSLGIRNREGRAPIHFAAQCGNFATTRALISCFVNLNAQCKQGMTPLMLAVTSGQGDCVRLLLEGRANPDLRCLKNQFSALHMAVARGDEKGDQMARLLIDAGADPLCQTARGRTPIHLAVENADVGILRTLLSAKVDSPGGRRRGVRPNIANHDQQTPLHLAVASGNIELARVLLEHDASPNLRDAHGRGALAVARAHGAPSRLIEALVSFGAV